MRRIAPAPDVTIRGSRVSHPRDVTASGRRRPRAVGAACPVAWA